MAPSDANNCIFVDNYIHNCVFVAGTTTTTTTTVVPGVLTLYRSSIENCGASGEGDGGLYVEMQSTVQLFDKHPFFENRASLRM